MGFFHILHFSGKRQWEGFWLWKSFPISGHLQARRAGSLGVVPTTAWLSQPPACSSPHRLRHIHHRENILEAVWQPKLYLLKVNPRLQQKYSIRGLLNFLIKCNQGALLSRCQVKAMAGKNSSKDRKAQCYDYNHISTYSVTCTWEFFNLNEKYQVLSVRFTAYTEP